MLAFLLAACSSSIECPDPATVIAEAGDRTLTCAEAEIPERYLRLLGARALPDGDRQILLKHARARFHTDPSEAEAWLAGLRESGRELEQLWGLRGAERRATRVWEAVADEGPIREADGAAWKVQSRALSVWVRDDESRLALTESDIEGWLLYGSLCREVQGGTVLRVSVADRVTVYKMVVARFEEAERAGQVALAAVGPYWPAVKEAWSMAPYETQQAWIARAPLPPPMTATSLGYVGAVIDGDLVGHASALHDVLGPLPATRERWFTAADD